MTRVRRFNAHKDYLVSIVSVISGGHYDQGRDSECKAYYYYFYIQQFCFDLPDCTSTLILMMNTAIITDLLMMVMLLWLLLSLSVFSPLLGL